MRTYTASCSRKWWWRGGDAPGSSCLPALAPLPKQPWDWEPHIQHVRPPSATTHPTCVSPTDTCSTTRPSSDRTRVGRRASASSPGAQQQRRCGRAKDTTHHHTTTTVAAALPCPPPYPRAMVAHTMSESSISAISPRPQRAGRCHRCGAVCATSNLPPKTSLPSSHRGTFATPKNTRDLQNAGPEKPSICTYSPRCTPGRRPSDRAPAWGTVARPAIAHTTFSHTHRDNELT